MTKIELQAPEAESAIATVTNGNRINRSNMRNCTVTSSSVKRSDFADCVLSQVHSVRRSTATKSQFYNVSSASRSTFTNSIIQDGSGVRRSEVKMSTVTGASSITRSMIKGSTIADTSMSRSILEDCEAEECYFERCNFQGMILKNGYWKRNKLVKKVGFQEPIAVKKDGSGPANYATVPTSSSSVNRGLEMDSKPAGSFEKHALRRKGSDSTLESDESDDSEDLPPPYQP